MTGTPTPRQRERCRHSGSWLLFGGRAEWCWQCGAYRSLGHGPVPNSCAPVSDWAYPQGRDGENPWSKFQRSVDARAIRARAKE